ncbi:MAG: type II toxin-antitoxin system HicA family toxin [Gemmatimonadetes bacterium]|nr:type II toxin-antitoxin system HicA family toxin [Gemmatimonadota bacterium]MCH8145891.1 type II toxin-antitoxin system HicA family toxin [Gemmatimonadota bacterium]MCH8255114.1 type II toxin-antitoxin system HicA family toxin [Gemmatimonadota bacterium]MCH8935566.1 type II toxin-antitoxin system HicA family toxin [Gemmatimonadota bacterium]
MTRSEKTLSKVLRGTSDASIAFEELRQLMFTLGFDERIRGSHHIFTRDGIEEILNLQPKGSKAKPYQVKQVRRVILTYRLAQVPDEE